VGFLWDLVQQSQISEQSEIADSLEERVNQLENDLFKTRKLLHKLVTVLENELGKDLDGDGNIG